MGKAGKHPHTPKRKTRTWRASRAYAFSSFDVFDVNDRALGYIEADQFGIDVYRKNGKKAAVSLAWRLALSRLLAVVMVAAVMVGSVQAEPRRARRSHNYILERQEAYQVQGVPTSRLIIGKREIDIYPNGLMFEGNNVVGVRKGK
jgi:hypothetical protein